MGDRKGILLVKPVSRILLGIWSDQELTTGKKMA